MIKQETFTKENIERIVVKYKTDFELAARAVFALGLVEALSKVGADFVFKGGSSLMLLFDSPRRLSTDVDILVPPNYDIDFFIKEASKIFPFVGFQESIRKTSKTIFKRHFKFTYKSTNSDKDFNVLLDVLFADNHYVSIVEKPINNDLLICNGTDCFAKIPSPESLLLDKLTAFAPHTIGIQFYGKDFSNDKRLEVIKQFFDISCLFDVCHQHKGLKKAYESIAMDEIRYRQLKLEPKDCLWDSFNSALSIISLGKLGDNDFDNYVSGFRKITGHVLGVRLNPNTASLSAAKIMFLSACLICNKNPFDYEAKNHDLIEKPPYNKINFLKKTNKDAFDYAATAISILGY